MEIVTIRLKARASRPNTVAENRAPARGLAGGCRPEKRRPSITRPFLAQPVYDRTRLTPGLEAAGPALVVDFGSTTFLPRASSSSDAYRNLIIRKKS